MSDQSEQIPCTLCCKPIMRRNMARHARGCDGVYLRAEDRFWAKVYKATPDGCWLWTAHVNKLGYGRFWDGSRQAFAHRFSYEAARGPIPDGMVLDHLCRTPACVNPAHLEVVSNGENVRRGVGITALNARKTHCKRGHEFTPENTAIFKKKHGGTWRKCRTCHRDLQREAYRAAKGEQK